MCDKPMTFDLKQAEELAKVVQKTGVVFAVTHNYTGYPLVRQAREMVLAGELGEINAIRAFYIQGWLRTRLETESQKQASWRTDPKRSGAAGCFGDIGTHAYNLGRFITGLIPEQISCLLKTFEQGRPLDDYGVAVMSNGQRRSLATLLREAPQGRGQPAIGRDPRNCRRPNVEGTQAQTILTGRGLFNELPVPQRRQQGMNGAFAQPDDPGQIAHTHRTLLVRQGTQNLQGVGDGGDPSTVRHRRTPFVRGEHRLQPLQPAWQDTKLATSDSPGVSGDSDTWSGVLTRHA